MPPACLLENSSLIEDATAQAALEQHLGENANLPSLISDAGKVAKALHRAGCPVDAFVNNRRFIGTAVMNALVEKRTEGQLLSSWWTASWPSRTARRAKPSPRSRHRLPQRA